MKRTEDVFDINGNLKLKRRNSWIEIWVGNSFTNVDSSLSDLIAALQQFQETGTFVPPKRYSVVPSDSRPGMYIIRDANSEVDRRRSCLSGDFLYLSESQAKQIAAILNEEGEE